MNWLGFSKLVESEINETVFKILFNDFFNLGYCFSVFSFREKILENLPIWVMNLMN